MPALTSKKRVLIGIRLILLCVLISIIVYVSFQSGLDDGLMVGFAVFLGYGGIDILFLTIWLDDKRDSSQKRQGRLNENDPIDMQSNSQ